MEKNKKKNSFLIATNRNYNTHAKIVVNQLEMHGALDTGEIIICCPFEINDNRVKLIKDINNQNGNVAFNEAAKTSSGEVLYILCDDHHVPQNIIRGDEFLNSLTFLNRIYVLWLPMLHWANSKFYRNKFYSHRYYVQVSIFYARNVFEILKWICFPS